MAGRRLRSYRCGDLAEDLGVLLLKTFAAVGAIPRPEDFGIDAVSTLLREGDKGLLYAEDSFYVQFKSAADRSIVYSRHEVAWAKQLLLPLFIGSVSREDAAIRLYTTHALSRAFIEEDWQQVTLGLDSDTLHLDAERLKQQVDAGRRDVYIGPPVLEWSTKQFSDDTFPGLAFDCVKPIVELEQRNIKYRSIRYCEWIGWTTNKPGLRSVGDMWFGSLTSRAGIVRVLEDMVPQVLALLDDAHTRQDLRDYDLLMSLVAFMTKEGVNPDPRGDLVALRETIQGIETGTE